jgi:predicted O-methyltransferase YrrM
MSLEIKYNTICSIPSDIVNHLPRFVKMVNDLNAQHVIELGTRTGVSTLAWLYALEKTGGKLTSIDIDPAPPIGDYDHWNFIQSDDLDSELLLSLNAADIVFIDTSHLYDQTIKELYAYLPLVRDGGLLVLHDTELMIPETATPLEPLYPVKKAVLEFIDETRFDFVIHEDCWGLAVIEVKKK